MNRLVGALAIGGMIVASGCTRQEFLAAPPAGYKSGLLTFLQTAPLDLPAASTPVISVMYTLPGTQTSSPLVIRPVANGRLPAHTTTHPVTGKDALKKVGLYVGVFSHSSIHYIARVNDPRNIRAESFDPASSAVLTRKAGGTYSVRVPLVTGADLVGFEVNPANTVATVNFYLKLTAPPPSPGGFEYDAEFD